jgi:hypothetical protein
VVIFGAENTQKAIPAQWFLFVSSSSIPTGQVQLFSDKNLNGFLLVLSKAKWRVFGMYYLPYAGRKSPHNFLTTN